MREILESLLTADGHRVTTAASGEEGLALARSSSFDAAVVDVMLPGIDGIETMQELKKLDDELPVVLVTAFASVETAIAAMKRGAFDYITKPFKNDEVLVVVSNAVERRQLIAENTGAAAEPARAGAAVLGHHRPQRADEAGVQPDHAGGAQPLDHPDHRRERHRQGAGGAGDPRQLVAQRPRLRDGQLGQPAAGSARVHALRPRQGRVHRRDQPQARACATSPTRGRCSSTRSATSRPRRRPSCSASSRSASSCGSAAWRRSRWTRASSPPPTAT